MVWLETKEVKKGSEEVRDGETKPTLEVCNKHHPLIGLRGGVYLVAGSAADHLGADPAGLA